MIRQNQKALNGVQVAIDSCCVVGSLILSHDICLRVQNIDILQLPQLQGGLAGGAAFCVVLLHLLFYFGSSLYLSNRSSGFLVQISKVLKSNLAIFVCMMVLVYSMGVMMRTQVFITVFFFLNTGLLLLYRLVLRKVLRILRRHGYNKKYLIILGVNDCTARFIQKVSETPDLGYGFLGYMDHAPSSEMNLEYLGKYTQLDQYFSRTLVDEAVIMPLDEPKKAAALIECCEKWGVKFSVVPNIFAAFESRVYISSFDGIPVLGIRKIPLENGIFSLVKRLFDIVVSLFCLVLFSPLMLAVAAAIKISSPGPVLFRQIRVGLNRKTFTMYKFRSMRIETQQVVKMAERGDERCTAVGKLIRRCSIDELPQLFNVLLGNMSLVGPRPEIPYFVEQFRNQIPSYMLKHYIKPGMTGWAQVHGLRGNTSIADRIRYDMFYIENWTFFLDVKILFLTLFKGVFSKNAY